MVREAPNPDGTVMKKIASFIADCVIKPVLILFFSVYHSAFMLAAPVVCIRLALETNGPLKGGVLALLRALFPSEMSGARLLVFVVFFLAAVAYCIAAFAIIMRIPMAIIKWNIARLTGLLYGNWLRALPYLLMMTGPALYVAAAIVLAYDGITGYLLKGMVITVIAQYGALSFVSIARSARRASGARGALADHDVIPVRGLAERAAALLPDLAVLVVSLPLVTLAVVTYRAAVTMAGSPQGLILFHVFLFQSMAGSLAFYWRHYDEFIELLTEDEVDDS